MRVVQHSVVGPTRADPWSFRRTTPQSVLFRFPRTIVRYGAVVAAACCLLTPGIQAQDEVIVTPGARIRVTGAAQRYVGTFEGLRADTLVLVDDSTRFIPLGSIGSFAVSRGKKQNTWSGAQTGLLIGASAGAVIGVLASSCPSGSSECAPVSTGGGIAAGALGGGLLGAVVGAAIGAATYGDVWEKVPTDRLQDVLRVPE